MSGRIFKLSAVAAVVASSIGCANSMTVQRHNEIVDAQKEYVSTLEKRNQELEGSVERLARQDDENKLARTTDDLYTQIAKQLEAALKDLRDDDGNGMTFDSKNASWNIGTDLLFAKGSWTITAKGKEALKKFADAHKAHSMRFRIVGHTDKSPIVREATKKELDTDTNMELSVVRAVAVMGQLKEFGLAESSFAECVGKGSTSPASATDMKKNRRVEIFVVKGASAPLPTSAPKTEAKKTEKKK